MDRPRKTTKIGSKPAGDGQGRDYDATEIRDDGADRTEPSLPRLGLPQLPDERFRIVESIGSGGFGDVYRAYDGSRRSYVALKILRADSHDALDRFKREFRTLQQLTHPGLVALHELSVNEGRWFFTMEFIHGVDFLTWVRAGQKAEDPDPEAPLMRRRRPACDLGRLMRCARQLAEVLAFVHSAQHYHRDIKPSNVMVAEGERIVLLDFGLVKGSRGNRTQAFRAYGTPRYIAPEQARGRDGAAASDWYAFGTMLYEAIAGRTPFLGTNDQMLNGRTRTEAPPLGLLVEDLEPDIERFVMTLLAREPAKRPPGAEILAWLNARAPSLVQAADVGHLPRPVRAGFVGRHAELKELNALFTAAQSGVARVHVRGQSGIGKSALVEQFMTTLELEGRALAVRSRCFECESVPYKAFEGLIDELRVLFESTPGVAIPPGFDALVRIFPVLRTLDPELSRSRVETYDAPELRRRAMGALAELLERLAGGRPVALSFDDVQWGDVESAYLLLELARRRSSRRMILLISYRAEAAESSECVELLESNLVGAEVSTLDVEPLPSKTSRQLLRACTGARIDLTAPAITSLLEDADGNAFLIEELARYVNEHDGSVDPRMTLRRLLRERLGMLPHDALRLLRVVCVAGNPIDESVAALAANAQERGRHLARSLIGDRRLRRVGVEGREIIAYHDRIRAEVVATLNESELVDTHLRIARAMQSLGFAKPETLLVHLLAAGQLAEAARYAITAARRASSSLAFDRAAELYDTALSIAIHTPEERAELLFEHARVLSYKGRGAEASKRYLEVAELATTERAHECRRLAAEQLLRSGHIDEGMRLSREVLRTVGVNVPTNNWMAIGAMIARRAWLRRRGLAHVPREASHVPSSLLERIDTAHNIAISLGLTDIVRGFALHSQSLAAALEAGEPHRLARALAFDAAYTAASIGTRDAEYTSLLLRTARTIARGLDDPYVDAMLDISSAVISWSQGGWDQCVDSAHRGIEQLLREFPGAVWEIGFGRTQWLDGLAWGGRWRAMGESLESLLGDATERGDLGQEVLLRTRYFSTANLAADAPDRSRDGLRTIERWSREGFHIEHLVVAYQSTEIALYEGNPKRAWDDVNGFWPDLERSRLLLLQPWKIQMCSARARAAVAAASQLRGGMRADALKQARSDVAAVRKEKTQWGNALCDAVDANIAAVEGRANDALRLLEDTIRSNEAANMRLIAASARYAYGTALGGDAGRAEVERAKTTMLGEGVAVPAHLQRALVPFALTEAQP